MQHRLKNDKYVNARGGNSHFLDLYCSRCGQHLALYQKDGRGSLLRIYLDRIFEPQKLTALQFKSNSKKDVSSFKCSKCGALIGTPMVYDPERRLAFRLLRGSFVKKKSNGIYPPPQQFQNPHNIEKGKNYDKKIKFLNIADIGKRAKMSTKEVNDL